MLKLKGQNINQLLFYVDFFIFYVLYNVAECFKNVLKRQKKAHLKRKIEGRAF